MFDPLIGRPYQTTPAAFLGGIDTYDREETVGHALEQLDIKKPLERNIIILNYCIAHLNNRNYRKKYLTWLELKKALEDKDYNFEYLIKDNPQEYSSLAFDSDDIGDAKGFFQEIFDMASVVWKEDIDRAQLENPSTWKTVSVDCEK